MSIATFLVLALGSTASAIENSRLRGGRHRIVQEAEVSTYRLVISEDLLRKQDGVFSNVEHIMAIPIIDGSETDYILSVDFSTDFISEYYALRKKEDFYISTSGGVVVDDVLHIPPDAQYTVLDEAPVHHQRQRNLATTGKKTVAALRVGLSSGTQVVYSTTKIRQHLFEKEVSLAKQMEKCSNGELILESAGVFEVTVPGQISDFNSPAQLRNKALEIFAESKDISQANAIADFVIVILPENDFPGFVGNAATGGWISTLNNEWSLDVMVYMHEIGHNLGLGHAYLTDNSGDYSSYMSATGWEPNLEGPRKCFNAASNRLMGWYSNRTRSIDMLNDSAQYVTLAAFSETKMPDKEEPVLLQVGDYTLQYNFASDFNSGTELLRDLVTVSHSQPGKTIVEKNGLGPAGNIFSVDNFNGSGKTLQIQACDKIIGDDQTPNSMSVAMTLGVPGSPCQTLKPLPNDALPECPNTSKNTIVFQWGSGQMSVQCKWIDDEHPIRQQFCIRKSHTSPGNKRVYDICQQECSGYAKCHRGHHIDD